MSRLFLLFAIVPFMELYVLIQVGSELGLFTTIGLVMLTAGIGAWLARSQGLEVLARIQAETAAGHTPTDSLLDGACILLAGILLLTPGFITDCLGLCLLFPPTRMAIRGWLGKNMASAFAAHPNGFGHGGGQGGFHFGGHGDSHGQTHQDAYDATFTSTGESGTYSNASNASGGQDYRGGSDTTVYNGTGAEAPRNPFGNGMRVVMHTTTIGPDGQRVSNTRTFQQGGNPFQGMNIDPETMAGNGDSQSPRKTVIIDSKPINDTK